MKALSRTNVGKLQHIVEQLGRKQVEQMACVSNHCLRNALNGRRVQAAQRGNLERVIITYFERHPEELPLPVPPTQAAEVAPEVPNSGPTECLVEGDSERLSALISVALAMGLRVTF